MKRLTVDQTWEQCLAMWKWISRRCKGKSWQWCKYNVEELKNDWCNANDFVDAKPLNTCFFCDRSDPSSLGYQTCSKCPGAKVDTQFSCHRGKYHYTRKPRLFYAELKRLNKVRLAKKK